LIEMELLRQGQQETDTYVESACI